MGKLSYRDIKRVGHKNLKGNFPFLLRECWLPDSCIPRISATMCKLIQTVEEVGKTIESNLSHLLRISVVCHWFVFIILKNDVLQQSVRNVLHNVPLDRKTTSPLVLLPVFHCLAKINLTHHLSKTNKLSTGVNLKNQGRPITSISNLTHCSRKEKEHQQRAMIKLTENNMNTGELLDISLASR